MRTTLLAILLCTGVASSAQNWALINPDYKYNYSNDGTDTISNQVFVTHVDTLGVDSFRYDLNRIGSCCEPCPDAPASCDSGSGVHTGMAQFIGGQILRSGAEIRLIDMDTLVIMPWAADGANWPSPSGGLATILFSADTIIWGQADSVKIVQYADGRLLRISKMHGVVHTSDTAGEHLLVGVQGGMNAGVHFCRMRSTDSPRRKSSLFDPNPQPDSPASPRASPGRMVRSTPSTARTWPTVR